MLNHTRHGHGKTLVLLHGYAGGLGYWEPVITGLKNAFDIVAVDLPGFAGSADVPAPDTLSGYAQTVIDLMDDLGVDKFSLIGFSMGGMIAQQLVHDHPARVEAQVLYGSSAVGDLPHRFEPWEAAIERVRQKGVEVTTDKTSVTWFVDGADHPYYPNCREAGRGANPDSCITVMRAMQGWSSLAWLADINLPTLIIVGDRDKSTTPSDSIVLWEAIPDANLCVIPNTAHGLHMEKPDIFNRVVGNFLIEHLYGRARSS